jgi:hypothetical protein
MKRALKLIPLATLVAASTATAAPAMAASPPKMASVIEASANIPAPAVLSAAAYSPLGAYGGRTLIQARVNTAVTSCQLKLLSQQSFAVTYATNARYCHVNFYAYVTVAANPTPVYRSVAFEVIGRNAWGQFSRGMVYINVAPKGSDYHAPAPPVVNTSPPPPLKQVAPPEAPAIPSTPSWPEIETTQVGSDNWSGYQLTGSNFSSVSGTFTVPSLQADETCRTGEAQWVGIDGGVDTGDNDLIQAGIMETPNVFEGYGPCLAPTNFNIYAWWDILPAGATEIPSMAANVGDRVTVSIRQSPSPDEWVINVTDDSNGQTFEAEQWFSGPGLSAEWISESYSDGLYCAGGDYGTTSNECTETGYTPAVSYSGLGYNHNADVMAVTAVTMEQYLPVSTPSVVSDIGSLMSNGFTTSYTGY